MVTKNRNGRDADEAQLETLGQMNELRTILKVEGEVMEAPAPARTGKGEVESKEKVIEIQEEPEEVVPPDGFQWKKRADKKKTTTVRCIVIDRKNRWHKGAPVDLKGANMTSCTWGYYGEYFPVLVETEDGNLLPWHLPDIIGESSNRLYKAANPDNYKNAVELESSNILQKIQIGLMVAVVLGLFFLMYVLLNQ